MNATDTLEKNCEYITVLGGAQISQSSPQNPQSDLTPNWITVVLEVGQEAVHKAMV